MPGRHCRTTKMRERDARAAIAANAAQMRLCVKTVIARLAQSPGTGGRICKAEKSKTQDTSDTQFVAEGVAAFLVLAKTRYRSLCPMFSGLSENLSLAFARYRALYIASP